MSTQSIGSLETWNTAHIGIPQPPDNSLAKAVTAHLQGNTAQALDALESGEGTDSAERIAARAHLCVELGRQAQAATEYEKLCELRPHYAEGHYQLGACRYHLAQFDKAFESFSRGAAIDPSRADLCMMAGICLLQLKRPEDSLDAFTACLEKAPGLETALLGKAVALQLTYELDEAAAIYQQVLERNPACEDALINLVALGMQRKDYALVRIHADILLRLQPKAIAALEGLSSAAFAAGAYQEAATHYTKLVEIEPKSYDYWFNLGVAKQRGGDLLDAAMAYSNAATLRPDLPGAHVNVAVTYNQMGDLQGSRDAFERALRVAPERDDLHYQRAVVVEQMGNAEEAEGFYAALAARNPGNENAWFRLGNLQLARADYAAAAHSFQACLNKRPIWTEAEINLGLAYWKLERHTDSRRVLDKILEHEPGSVEAVRGLAANALDDENLEDALKWHHRLQELGDASPEVLHNTGLLMHKGGNLDAAIESYQAAVSARPHFAEALLNLGHVFQAAGRSEEARVAWAKALDLKPEFAQGYFLPTA